MDKIAEGTWFCGDPGMQYEDTIQQLAHLPQHRADQQQQSLQRIHVHR